MRQLRSVQVEAFVTFVVGCCYSAIELISSCVVARAFSVLYFSTYVVFSTFLSTWQAQLRLYTRIVYNVLNDARSDRKPLVPMSKRYVYCIVTGLFFVLRCTAKPETIALWITKYCSSVVYSSILTGWRIKCLLGEHLSLKTIFWCRHDFRKGSPTIVLAKNVFSYIG